MIPSARKLGVRWTVGNVSPRGFEELRLSIHSAMRLFGPDAAYAVCVNSLPLEDARRRTGSVPEDVSWHDISGAIPAFLASHFDAGMSEGVGWKLAPLRLFRDRHELSLDNDCILWSLPTALENWLAREDACLMTEDVQRCLGQFDDSCPPGNLNSGIRGLPPGFDFQAALEAVLREREAATGEPVLLRSELDEQGLQASALARSGKLLLVSVQEVTVCSPLWPHRREVGTCGAHFVGSNVRHLPWNYYDRPADAWMEEHWQAVRPEIYRRLELSVPAAVISIPVSA